MNKYSFDERLAFSNGIVGATCLDTIKAMMIGVDKIERSTLKDDKNGIDYWVTLRRGARVGIDHKARDSGCSRFWTNGEPELSLELWSVLPENGNAGVVGWTLSETKNTDYTLHTFDKKDTDQCYLLPFQLLRMAFRSRCKDWMKMMRGPAIQNSGRWKSQCVFVPAFMVLDAIQEAMVN